MSFSTIDNSSGYLSPGLVCLLGSHTMKEIYKIFFGTHFGLHVHTSFVKNHILNIGLTFLSPKVFCFSPTPTPNNNPDHSLIREEDLFTCTLSFIVSL